MNALASSSAWPVAGRGHRDRRIYHLNAAPTVSSAEVRQVNLRPMVEQPPAWVVDAADRLMFVLNGAPETAPEAIEGIWEMISDPIFAGTPMPLLSPIAGGGLSAEFRAAGVEMLLEVAADGTAEVYVVQPGRFEWDGSLADLPDGIEKWAWRLAHSGL